MDSFIALKNTVGDFEAEISVCKPDTVRDELSAYINEESEKTEIHAEIGLDRLNELKKDINRLTCNAELSDYAVSAMCGLLAGRLNSVINKVSKLGYGNIRPSEEKNENSPYEIADLTAVLIGETSERKNTVHVGALDPSVPMLTDGSDETGAVFSESLLGDIAKACGEELPEKRKKLSHSSNLLGLVLSICEQFSNHPSFKCERDIAHVGAAIEITPEGNFVSIEKNGKIFSGILNWFFNVARDMALDTAPAKSRLRVTGAFSSLLTVIRELSQLPCVREEKFLKRLYDSFSSFISGKEGEKLRADMNIIFVKENEKGLLKKQQSTVMLNELLVRSVFFVRGFIRQISEKHSVSLLNYSELIPSRDRTLNRMLTVSIGVFTAVDITRASVRAVAKGGAISLPKFLFDTVLKVNIAGIGRFALELKSDIEMLLEKDGLRDERIRLCGEQLALGSARVFYRQAGMWVCAEDTVKTLSEACRLAEKAVELHVKAINDMDNDLKEIKPLVQKKTEKQRAFFGELTDMLKY